MTLRQAQDEVRRLARCRDMLAAIHPGVWTRVHDAEGCFVEARGDMGELIAVARFTGHASEAEIDFAVESPETVRFLLGLVDRAARTVRTLRRSTSAHEAQGEGSGDTAGGGKPDRASAGQAAPAEGQRAAASETAREPNYSAECAMKCGEPGFRVFLEERHGLSFDGAQDEAGLKARAAQKVRSVLGVTSRAELNDGGRAAAAWKALRGDFENWKRAGR